MRLVLHLDPAPRLRQHGVSSIGSSRPHESAGATPGLYRVRARPILPFVEKNKQLSAIRCEYGARFFFDIVVADDHEYKPAREHGSKGRDEGSVTQTNASRTRGDWRPPLKINTV